MIYFSLNKYSLFLTIWIFMIHYIRIKYSKKDIHTHKYLGMKVMFLRLPPQSSEYEEENKYSNSKNETKLLLFFAPLSWVMTHNHQNWWQSEYFCTIINVLIIHLSNSSPNVLKVSNTLITCQQCPELLSTWWLMTLSLRQYCFNMISNRATWTANNTQNKLESNLWIKHRTLTLMQQKLNCRGQNTDPAKPA